MRNHQEQGNRNHPHASICVIFVGMNDCFARNCVASRGFVFRTGRAIGRVFELHVVQIVHFPATALHVARNNTHGTVYAILGTIVCFAQLECVHLSDARRMHRRGGPSTNAARRGHPKSATGRRARRPRGPGREIAQRGARFQTAIPGFLDVNDGREHGGSSPALKAWPARCRARAPACPLPVHRLHVQDTDVC